MNRKYKYSDTETSNLSLTRGEVKATITMLLDHASICETTANLDELDFQVLMTKLRRVDRILSERVN
jgi:hypothetical protein